MKISHRNKKIADENLLAELNQQLCVTDEQTIKLWDGKKWYEIEFATCNTNKKIIQWIDCLTRQSWITVKHIELFIQVTLVKRSAPTKNRIIFKALSKRLA